MAVTDEELRVQQAFHDWDGFTEYERTDDKLTLYRDTWYQSKFLFDLRDVANIDTIIDAIDEYLSAQD